MTTPKVWNTRAPHVPAEAVYVGRPTKWGNMYKIGADGKPSAGLLDDGELIVVKEKAAAPLRLVLP